MINIQPIELLFFGTVNKVIVRVPELVLGGNGATICTDLLASDGTIWKTLSQPLPDNIYQNWGTNDNYVIDWALAQNGIVKAN